MSDLLSYNWWENKRITDSQRLDAIAAATKADLLKTDSVRARC